MKMMGTCHICGKPAMASCSLCGKVTCRNCLDIGTGGCKVCLAGTMEESDDPAMYE